MAFVSTYNIQLHMYLKYIQHKELHLSICLCLCFCICMCVCICIYNCIYFYISFCICSALVPLSVFSTYLYLFCFCICNSLCMIIYNCICISFCICIFNCLFICNLLPLTQRVITITWTFVLFYQIIKFTFKILNAAMRQIIKSFGQF